MQRLGLHYFKVVMAISILINSWTDYTENKNDNNMTVKDRNLNFCKTRFLV